MSTQTASVTRNYKANRTNGDKYLPDVASILAEFLGTIRVSTIQEDTKAGADLVVNDADIGLGVRIRDAKYDGRYGDEFTIRSWHPKSKRCELDKLLENKPRLLFYGFASKERGIYKYAIIITESIADAVRDGRYTKQTNKDGIEFYAFNLKELAEHYPGSVIHSKGY